MTRKEARSHAGDFDRMNEVYRCHVRDAPPARATVRVSALPSGALVEISAVALAS
jgi:2-iminobutanoate/2-iminopropanoate deaminase